MNDQSKQMIKQMEFFQINNAEIENIQSNETEFVNDTNSKPISIVSDSVSDGEWEEF